MAEKTVKVVAVADDVGYTVDGVAQYAERGAEFEIPEKDYARHGERTKAQLDVGNFPAVVKVDHPHAERLVAGVPAAVDPSQALAMMKAIHGGGAAPLLDPAGNSVSAPSTVPAPAQIQGTLNIDLSVLDRESLDKLADSAGIETSGMKKAEVVAALQGAPSDAGVTPRVGDVESAETRETAPSAPAEG